MSYILQTILVVGGMSYILQTILVVGGMSYILQTILVVGGMNSTNNLSSRGYEFYKQS